MTERHALVTGAANGIGLATCAALIAQGVSVVGLDREETSSSLPMRLVRADLAELDSLAALYDELDASVGGFDVLVNAAGVAATIDPRRFSIEEFQRVVAVNLSAAVVLSSSAASSMAARGYGRIVNVSSVHATHAERGGVGYDTSKGGLDSATRTLALEFGAAGVLVNAVAPGFIETRMAIVNGELETRTDAFKALYVEGGRLALRRAGQPEEVAELIAWLASEKNTYVTGQVVVIDGGLTITF